MDIESYKDKVIAKINSMSGEDLRMVFSKVLDGYEKPIPIMTVPVVFPNLSTKRTFILVFRRCNMYRKRGDIVALRRSKRK